MEMASAIAIVVSNTTMLFISLTTWPAPTPPHSVISVPMVARMGLRRANTASLPPTMIERVPSTAARRVRATGASAKSTPLASNASASSRISRGGAVDMSTTVCPLRASPRRPPGPRVTASTSLPPGRHINTNSALATASAWEDADATFSASKRCRGSGRVS